MPGRRREVRIFYCNLMKRPVERAHVVSLVLNQPEEVAAKLPQIPRDLTGFSVDQILDLTVETAVVSESQITDLTALITELSQLFSKVPARSSLMTHETKLTSQGSTRCKAYRCCAFSAVFAILTLSDCVRLRCGASY
ncbi:hypothetical protein HPB48_016886 [Haemaphysalis longicornis]|uniref:Uncharacterized protein n=1 Tax=Haemaphysalis longicornis TaxID=44386 RepID=A0A9J6G8K2_HAELO|nr:hypothetical protein HPB48_016886 [Haemaphysalis longicornis]